MTKNTPHFIVLVSAALNAILITLLVYLTQLLWEFSLPTPYYLLILVGAFMMIYWSLKITLGQWVVQKLNQILKIINRLRGLSDPKQNLNINQEVFKDLENRLKDWEHSQEEEIKSLKQAENYRREFIGNVSHELKTPIFSIQGYIQTLMDGALQDEAVNHKYLEKASKNADRLSTIIQDLEAISQYESGELKISIEKFDLKRLCNDVIESLELKAQENRIALVLNVNQDQPFMVRGDIGRIRQVLENLVSNSVKYGSENGNTQINFYEEGEHARIEITDDGIGIEQSHIPRLFERFYRVDKSRSRNQGGTGLGLAIVKHIIEAHNQTINVSSEVGQGTTFSFTIEKA